MDCNVLLTVKCRAKTSRVCPLKTSADSFRKCENGGNISTSPLPVSDKLRQREETCSIRSCVSYPSALMLFGRTIYQESYDVHLLVVN